MHQYWMFCITQDQSGKYVVEFSTNTQIQTSNPIEKLCDAVKIGKCMVNHFDQILSEDEIKTCVDAGLTPVEFYHLRKDKTKIE